MTILEPTLYANGALRLTRHGTGKGGNVLVFVPTGEQCEVSDKHVDTIDWVLSRTDSSSAKAVENAKNYFEYVRDHLRHL